MALREAVSCAGQVQQFDLAGGSETRTEFSFCPSVDAFEQGAGDEPQEGDDCFGCFAGIGERVGDDGAALDSLQRRGYHFVDDPHCEVAGWLMLARSHGDEKGHERTLCATVKVHRCAWVKGMAGVGSVQAPVCRALGCRRLDFNGQRLVEASYDRDPRDWIDGALEEGRYEYKLGLLHGAVHAERRCWTCPVVLGRRWTPRSPATATCPRAITASAVVAHIGAVAARLTIDTEDVKF